MSQPKQTVAVIPARYESTRLPRKLLLDLGGKSVLQRTYEQVLKSKHINKVVIAVDDQRLYDAAKSFGAEVYMTSPEHQSGTDRIAELARQNPDWNLIVNVQGDEPFIDPKDIDKAIEPFVADPLLEMSSLYHEITELAEIESNANVKVVTDLNNHALYFSRAVIPYERDRILRGDKVGIKYKKHIGLYAYRRDTLLALAALPVTELERSERLEQLRALENGIKIRMVQVQSAPIGIDTEADYNAALSKIVETY